MNNPPDIIAILRFYTTAEGGRNQTTPSNIFRCPLNFEGKLFDCVLDLQNCGALAPGAEAKVPIKFVRPQFIKPRLKTGDRFTLFEMKPIAEGIVDEVLH